GERGAPGNPAGIAAEGAGVSAYDFTVIGGGIVGLSAAMALGRRYPKAHVLLLEKEARLATHQTGRNSGVIHSGIYYTPGSYKAKFCQDGNRAILEFCRRHGIPYDVCGKVIVATDARELPLLENLYQRGLANGLVITKITAGELREIEPPVRGEYYTLTPEKRSLVKHLIYPVPNPRFPFLGVHFTRMIDGSVHAGPNAVLSLKREGYRKTDVNLRDCLDLFLYPAFWRVAA